jgi:hypothetical protein
MQILINYSLINLVYYVCLRNEQIKRLKKVIKISEI